MLCQGNEVYGVGTVQKIYAQSIEGLRFICMQTGPMLDWLRERGQQVELVEGLASFIAGGSVMTILRMPGALAQARRDARHLDALLRPMGVKILHTHWLPQQLIAGFMRRAGYRSVWHIHNNMNPQRLGGLGQKLNHRLARWGADLIMPVSGFIAHNWRGCGVPVEAVHNTAVPVYEQVDPLPTPPIRCVIAGRLSHSKGHHLAVQAVLAARQAGLDVLLDIFGGPLDENTYADHLQQVVRQASAHEAVRFMGFCQDLRQRHQQYHLGLQCRIDPEPCSMWVCETHRDGLPLIASDSGGTPELVQDGVTGLLYKAGDASDLTEKLIQLASQPDRINQMRMAAFRHGQEYFTIQRFVDQTFQAYSSIDGQATTT